MEKLSVVIITLNEEEHLDRCLSSVQAVADEILILDSFSTDQTPHMARAHGAVFRQHAFDGYISQKNRALDMARHDLVLSLDGDEALDEGAVAEILEIKKNRTADGYSFKRRNHYCGKWMRFTSMYPDRKIRLFDRKKARWGGYDPHDKIMMDPEARIIRLNASLLHWVYRDLNEHRSKTRSFARIAGSAYARQGRRAGPLSKYTHALARFVSEWIRHAGFLEGRRGWHFAILSARYTYLKYKHLKEIHDSERD